MFALNLLALGFAAGAASQSCYYPDGSLPSDYSYVACTGNTASSCCIPSEGDVCLESGLCYYVPGSYPFRGACTDKTWGSSNCPHYCMTDRPNEWQAMVQCGSSTSNQFCCSQDRSNLTCCNDASQQFTVDVNAVVNTYGSELPPQASSVSASIPTNRLVNPTSSGTKSPSQTSTSTSAPSTTTAVSAASATNTSQGRKAGPKIIAIAIGVAVPVFLIAGIVALCIYFEHRRRRHNSASGQTRRQLKHAASSNNSNPWGPSSPQPPMQYAVSPLSPPAYTGNGMPAGTPAAAKGPQASELSGSSYFGKQTHSDVHEVQG